MGHRGVERTYTKRRSCGLGGRNKTNEVRVERVGWYRMQIWIGLKGNLISLLRLQLCRLPNALIPDPLRPSHALVTARPWRPFPHSARHGNAV